MVDTITHQKLCNYQKKWTSSSHEKVNLITMIHV